MPSDESKALEAISKSIDEALQRDDFETVKIHLADILDIMRNQGLYLEEKQKAERYLEQTIDKLKRRASELLTLLESKLEK